MSTEATKQDGLVAPVAPTGGKRSVGRRSSRSSAIGSVVAVAGSAVDAVVVRDIGDGSMCLPNVDQAVVEERKLRDYLLSPSHPVGRFKAALFAQLGYSQEDWRRLEQDLREQHLVCTAKRLGKTRYGEKYRIAAPLTGPNGRRVTLVSVWIVRRGEECPRFVTAYRGGPGGT